MQKKSPSVIITTFCSSLVLIGSGVAGHAAPFSSLAIGPDIGSTGIGVQVSTPLWPDYLNLTAGYSGFAFTYRSTSSGQKYSAHLRLGGAPIYLSAYPLGPHFHLDAGIFINSIRINISALPNNGGVYVFNGHQYSKEALGEVTGETHLDAVAPYLGIGWGNPFYGGKWTFTVNAGVLLEGGSNVALRAPNAAEIPGAAANLAEAQRQFSDHVSFLNAYPVINLGFAYRF